MRTSLRLMARTLLVVAAGLVLTSPVAGQTATGDAAAYVAAISKVMAYRLIGPFRGGRVVAVAGIPDAPRTFYMGSTGGGVWKTTDGGENWSNVSDGFFTSASIGALAIAPSDPNVIYVGTGEACLRNNIAPGDGVYRSSDGGKTWRHAGLRDAGQIGRIRIHPQDPNLAYVAVLGRAFGPSPDRGVYRTRDGGATWERVLFVSDGAGAVDLALDVANPKVLYAATWEVVRKPWTLISGGAGSGVYKSSDGGDTWMPLTAGLPQGIKGRIGVTVSPVNPQRVWALVEAEDGGLYASADGGATFALVNTDRLLLARPFYYMHIYADPVDENTIYSMAHSRGFLKSTDGGRRFESIPTGHGDNHDVWINPQDPRILIAGDDGGASVSFNGGQSWSTQANQPTAEIYRLATDNQFPYRLYGAQQDNTTISIASRTTSSGIGPEHWYPVSGGEHGQIAVDPRDPNIVYGGSYEGILERYDHRTGQRRNILSYPQFGEGVPAKDLKYRFPILAPVRLSQHDPAILYHTSNVVHRSTNEGQSWTVVSPDLTRNDKSKQGYSGGPITRDHTGPETYCTIVAFEESPLRPGVLWAGSDDGLVHLSRDAATRWENVTPAAMPAWGTVQAIDPSPHDPGRAFLAVHRYREDDLRPYIFRTNDYGKSWDLLTSGTNGVPAHHFVRVVREDPHRKGLLYAGTEYGIYVSFDDGASWQSLQFNLPVTSISDLQIKEKDLAVATHGRAFWVLDDLTPLHQMDPQALSHNRLLKPRDAYRVQGSTGRRPRTGTNPPNGAVIYYNLAATPPGEIRLDIAGPGGRIVDTFSNAPNQIKKDRVLSAVPGPNRFVWDLRYPDAVVDEDAIFDGSTRGPKAVPGTYEVKLTIGAWSETQTFDVKKDPRITTTLQEFTEQLELSLQIRDRLTQTYAVLRKLRAGRRELETLMSRAGKADSRGMTASARIALDQLAEAENRLTNPRLKAFSDLINLGPRLDNDLADLNSVVQSADARPTDGARQRFGDINALLGPWFARVEAVVETELPRLRALAQQRSSLQR